MKFENIAECSPWSILQYFWPALSNNWSEKNCFGLQFERPLQTGFTVLTLTMLIIFMYYTIPNFNPIDLQEFIYKYVQ